MAEWDHGMEPTGSMESAASDNLDDRKGHGDRAGDSSSGSSMSLLESPKQLAKKVQIEAVKLFHDLPHACESAIHHDDEFQHAVAEHSQDEVAGMKLCVSDAVNSESFIIPY